MCSSTSRVFFLDYDGTLTAGQHTSITLAPLEEVLQVSVMANRVLVKLFLCVRVCVPSYLDFCAQL